jgi:hypothetical protein
MANAVRSVSAALGGPTVKTLIDLTASFSFSRSRTASSTATRIMGKYSKTLTVFDHGPISSKGFFKNVRSEGCVEEGVPHHGMFDAEVDAFLVWVDADLDGIVDAPGTRQGMGMVQDVCAHLLTGTNKLRSFADVGRILRTKRRVMPDTSEGR